MKKIYLILIIVGVLALGIMIGNITKSQERVVQIYGHNIHQGEHIRTNEYCQAKDKGYDYGIAYVFRASDTQLTIHMYCYDSQDTSRSEHETIDFKYGTKTDGTEWTSIGIGDYDVWIEEGNVCRII